MPEADAGFEARRCLALEQRGLTGKRVHVTFADGALHLSGSDSGRIVLPAYEVDRLRLGMDSTRWGTFQVASVFLSGEKEPVLLRTTIPGAPGYREAIVPFARSVAEAGGIDRLESGLSEGGAWVTLAFVFLVAAGFSAHALFVWGPEQGMALAYAFCVAMAAVVAMTAWFTVNRDRPRAMTSIDDVDRYMPGWPWR